MTKDNLLHLIKKENKYNIVDLDNLSFVEYKQHNEQIKNKVYTDKNLFIYVLKGKKILYSNFNNKFEINENESIFISRGNYLMSEVLSNDSNSFESLVFFFDESLLKEFFSLHQKYQHTTNFNTLDIFKVNVSPFLKANVFSLIPFFIYPNQERKNILKYKFFEILLEILNDDIHNNFIVFLNKISNSEISKLKLFLEDNFTKSYSIEDYAKLTNRSLSKFKNDFKFISDLTPKEWINNKRLEKSIFLIKTTYLNITQIALESGFENTSYFSKVFNKKYNMTPKAFQKSLKLQKK